MRKRLRFVGVPVAAAVVAAAALPLLSSPGAQAARFTGGNLVVYRVGSRRGADQRRSPGVPRRVHARAVRLRASRIALPTAAADGNLALTAVGQSRSEGLISNSADGRFIALTGYGAAPGATGPGGITLTASSPTSVPRVVGLVDGNGTVDTSTKLATAAAPSIIRSAATSNGEPPLRDRWQRRHRHHHPRLGDRHSHRRHGREQPQLADLPGQPAVHQRHPRQPARQGRHRCSRHQRRPSPTLPGLPDNLLTYGYALLDLTAARVRRYGARHALRRQRIVTRRHGRQVPLQRHRVDRESATSMSRARSVSSPMSMGVT